MKLKTLLLAAAMLVAGLQINFGADASLSRLAAANNAFSFKLLKQLAAEQPGTNIFISPYSAATVLQIACNGAVGRTKSEMKQVLETTALPEKTINAAYKKTTQLLNSENTNLTLNIANALWYRWNSQLKPEFVSQNQPFFDFTIGTFRLDDPHAENAVNAWASEKTHGKINHIMDKQLFMVDTPRLFLLNVVYFKGKWFDQFDAKLTEERPFFPAVGAAKNLPMMKKSKTFTYCKGPDYQAVQLPYVGGDLAMYIFLPGTNTTPAKLLEVMNGDNWRSMTVLGFSKKEGMLVLPKFKLECYAGLVESLETLGMKAAFGGEADFSDIAPGADIYSVYQKALIEVNEEGTEAAAATVLAMADNIAMPPTKPFEMIVDRPFLFAIVDARSEMILFMGLVNDL